MPKQVDHDQRRAEIAAAVARLATSRGLAGVSFREVAAEAGMSVANVQHYFGSKHALLVGTLQRQSDAMGARILDRLRDLDPAAGPLEDIRVVAESFMPTGDVARDAMVVYHSFANAAITDPALRSAEAFARGREVIALFTDRLSLARDSGHIDPRIDPAREAQVLFALVLGLSLCALLDEFDAADASSALQHHLSGLRERGRRPGQASDQA